MKPEDGAENHREQQDERQQSRHTILRKANGGVVKMSHQYTVELRVWGKDLDPKRVTEETGLVPCQTRARGDRLGSRTFDEAMWAFNGQGSAPTRDWNSLEEGLTFVLDEVGDAQSAFSRLASQFNVMWWCGHFQSSFDGGPELSPELLKRLATFGAALFIDNYFSPADSEDQTVH